jgi:hypothetical protein
MKRLLVVIALVFVCLLSFATLSFADYRGTLYNSCDGSCDWHGFTLDFYINGKFIVRLGPGQSATAWAPAGRNHYEVYKVGDQDHAPYKLDEDTADDSADGWWEWFGCKDGTHPAD